VIGPIYVKPGQNDSGAHPVTIEKPAYDGYMVRFKTDLVDENGIAPPIEQLHLHHGLWITTGDNTSYWGYRGGPFAGGGEEKTFVPLPAGYGFRVQPTDAWVAEYMVHNVTAAPRVVFLTYDVDFVSKAAGDKLGIVPLRFIWLDVLKNALDPRDSRPSSFPIFNVQKGFGHKEDGHVVCTFPRENCARHDPYGTVTAQQGRPFQTAGVDYRVTKADEGTIVEAVGHLHPGGLRNELSLVRGSVEKRVFDSEALYWRRDDASRIGGPPDSWDFSMTHTSAALGWKVKVKEGDVLRLNATYDAEASWYENMGIVGILVASKDPHPPTGVDVFDQGVTIDPGFPAGAALPAGEKATCTPSATRLCRRGQPTHGHLREADNFGGCAKAKCDSLVVKDGPLMTDIPIYAFTNGPSDIATIRRDGIPLVKLGAPLRFWNADTALGIWHTVTRCAAPCTGTPGIAYPLADGGTGDPGDAMDFDSGEIGYGAPLQAATQQASWTFTPVRTGTYTFFCRTHQWMRGAFKVVA
jgi:plastocyanin